MPRALALLFAYRKSVATTAALRPVAGGIALAAPGAALAADGTVAGGFSSNMEILVVLLGIALIAALAWGVSARRRMSLLQKLFENLQTPRLVTRIDGTEIAATESWRAMLGGMEGSLITLRRRLEETSDDAVAKFERLLQASKEGREAQEEFHLGRDGIEYARISVETPDTGNGQIY